MKRAISGVHLHVLFNLLSLCLSVQMVTAGIIKMPTIEESPSLQGTSIYDNYNIPSINNRSQNTEDSPRLWVKKISLQGAMDFPASGIRLLEVQAYIEKLRFDIMRESEIEQYGYSQKELAEIASLLNKIDSENNYQHVNTSDLQRFIWLVRNQKEQRGLSISEIEYIAGQVEIYYRHHGLQMVKRKALFIITK